MLDYARCPKCGEVINGVYTGNIMISLVISIHHANKPNTPIATMIRCGKCPYIGQVKLTPEGEKKGLTRHDVLSCYKSMPLDCYTLSELKAGKVRGVLVPDLNIDYDPNKTTEGKLDKEFK